MGVPDQPELELPLSKSPTQRESISKPASARSPSKLAKPQAFLINAARVRQYALDVAERERHHEFTAVSVEFLQKIDARLRNFIRDEVARHPSRGKRLV